MKANLQVVSVVSNAKWVIRFHPALLGLETEWKKQQAFSNNLLNKAEDGKTDKKKKEDKYVNSRQAEDCLLVVKVKTLYLTLVIY